jgi:hypothetical protein
VKIVDWGCVVAWLVDGLGGAPEVGVDYDVVAVGEAGLVGFVGLVCGRIGGVAAMVSRTACV